MRKFREIVRVIETDCDGSKPVERSIRNIKGMGFEMSRAVILMSGVPGDKVLKELSEPELRKVEDVIKNPGKYTIPAWMMNRRKDPETGTDTHLTGTNLIFIERSDIDAMKKIRSYKGIRHEMGQPVRGQRTKNTSRKSGRAIGVSKKKLMPGHAPAAAPAPATAPVPAKK